MSETILIGRGRAVETMPREQWEAQLSKVPEVMKTRLGFMTPEHHLVRYFVVRELPRLARPIEPERIAESLGISLNRINEILVELERNLFFLVRNAEGHVSWSYPVTVEKTPHRMAFSTGEQIYGA